MIRKVTVLSKNRTIVQAFSLGPNKNKRRCLRYLGAISRFESGNHNPSRAFLQRIAEGLGKKIYVEFR